MLNIGVQTVGKEKSTQSDGLNHTKPFLVPALLFLILGVDLLPSPVRTGRLKPSRLKRAVTLVKSKLGLACRHWATGWRRKGLGIGAQLSKDCKTASLHEK